MPWFKVDDKFGDHPKVRRLGKDVLAAVGLWILCGTWCSDNVTTSTLDGFVPVAVARRHDPRLRLARKLVEVGLWHETTHEGEVGFLFHQWNERQPSRSEVEDKRANNAAKVAAWRARQAAKDANSRSGNQSGNRVTDQGGNQAGNPAPVPEPVPSSPNGEEASTREDVEALCIRLRDRMIANGDKPPTITKRWRDEARRLLDIDERPLDKALALIDWATADAFWRANIRSMPTFRDKYDQLRLKALNEWERGSGQRGQQPNGRPATGSKRVDKALAALDPNDPFLAEYAAAQQQAVAPNELLVIEGGRTA